MTAARSKEPTGPVRDLLRPVDLIPPRDGGQANFRLTSAYQVQAYNVDRLLRWGKDRIVGRKVGLTAPSVQAQLVVVQPDFGTILSSMQVQNDEHIDIKNLLDPRIEAEVAFELSEDLTDVPEDKAELVSVIARAVPSLEIVDSRIADWDITL